MHDPTILLIGLCSAVLIAYLFDHLSKHVRVPSVVMLLLAGFALRALLDAIGFKIPYIQIILPIIGTFGLILIVLESALDLEVARDKTRLMLVTAASASLGIAVTGALIAIAIRVAFDVDWLRACVYATPFAVISSAVAIPAARALREQQRNFVVYESALSDIFGVLLFYGLVESTGSIGGIAVATVFQLVTSCAIGFAYGAGMYVLLQRIDHHVRFVPLIFALAFIYGVGKLMHLAPLAMVLVAGLTINNHTLLTRIRVFAALDRGGFAADLASLKQLTGEFTFVVRTFFFLLLGYSTAFEELLDSRAWVLGLIAMLCTLVPRAALLHAMNIRVEPLLWFAPRGLITILLFLSIPGHYLIDDFPTGALMLTVLLSAVALTYGTVRRSIDTPEVILPPIAETDNANRDHSDRPTTPAAEQQR